MVTGLRCAFSARAHGVQNPPGWGCRAPPGWGCRLPSPGGGRAPRPGAGSPRKAPAPWPPFRRSPSRAWRRADRLFPGSRVADGRQCHWPDCGPASAGAAEPSAPPWIAARSRGALWRRPSPAPRRSTADLRVLCRSCKCRPGVCARRNAIRPRCRGHVIACDAGAPARPAPPEPPLAATRPLVTAKAAPSPLVLSPSKDAPAPTNAPAHWIILRQAQDEVLGMADRRCSYARFGRR